MTAHFTEFQLDPRIQSAIDKSGYKECTPVQEQVIPLVMAGKDVSGLAQTGTGKTAAFLIPLMDRILKGQFADWKPTNFILILVPTRELAEQVFENVTMLSEFSGLRGVSVYGGTGYEKQKEAFKNQVEFVVATPGRLIDLFKEHYIDLKQVRAIVFDEADRMFDMGFKDDMKYILQRVPKERQFLVFSATLNFDVLNTAYQFGADPIEINVSRDQAKAENVRDVIFHCGHDEKPAYLLSLIRKHNPKQVIIFSNFKNNVERLAQFLSNNGVPAMGISSLLTQVQRNRVLELFKAENEKNVLVATDVAARGLDIKGVDMVINYELPNDAESYVHRIGRTGRAGTEGQAFSLVCDRDVDSLARVQDYLKHKLDAEWLDEADLVKDLKPFPSDRPYRSEKSNRPFAERGPRSGGSGGGPRDRDRGPRQGSGGGGAHAGGPRPSRNDSRRPDLREPRRADGTARPQNANGNSEATGGAAKPHHHKGPRPATNGAAHTKRAEGGKPHRHENGRPKSDRGPRPAGPKQAHAGKAAPAKTGIKGLLKKIFSFGSK
jgi:ATP-dependent RNA helicase RhlB